MLDLFRKSIFALDISDFSIEALQIDRCRRIKRFGRVILKKKIVENGFILNKEKLIQEIKKVLSRARIRAKNVILAIPDSKTFVCIFKIPMRLKQEQIESAVRSEAEKTIPLEIEKLYWDYKIVSHIDKDCNILFVATLREIIDDYIEVLEKIRIKPVAFEPESVAIGRAVLGGKKFNASVLVVDIGARTTNIAMFDKDGVLQDSVTVELAGEEFTRLIAKELKITSRQAEEIKRKVGFIREKNQKVASLLKKAIRPVIKEIKKIIEYHNQKIQKIFLVGGSSQLPKIDKFFTSSLGIKTEVGICPLAKQLKKYPILFNTVAGLALRTIKKNSLEEDINLSPFLVKRKRLFHKKQKEFKKIRGRRFLEILMIIVVALLFWGVYILLIKSPPLSYPSRPSQQIPSIPKTPSLQSTPSTPLVPEEETSSLQVTGQATTSQATSSQEKVEEMIIVLQTETGWLNVRMGPGIEYPIIKKIYPGESYPLLDEFDKWYKIKISKEKAGWIFSHYAEKTQNNQ